MWKCKSFFFSILSYIPFGEKLLRLLQLRPFGRSRKKTESINPIWIEHKKVLDSYCSKPISIIEFGAGNSLGQNLYFSNPLTEQYLYDLHPMFNAKLSDLTAFYLSSIGILNYKKIKCQNDLKHYNIKYYAPFDVLDCHLNDYFDYSSSTNTLEHIPKNDLKLIFIKLHKLIKTGGIISLQVDYSDHYSHTDKKIHPLNFLKYNKSDWRKYNHRLHYQNRLRHSDYCKIFEDSGFCILESKVEYCSIPMRFKISEEFTKYDEKSISSLNCFFILQKI